MILGVARSAVWHFLCLRREPCSTPMTLERRAESQVNPLSMLELSGRAVWDVT